MSSSSSNNAEGDSWLMQMELRREDVEGATMEEDEGDSLQEQPPASERDETLTPSPLRRRTRPSRAIRTRAAARNQPGRATSAPRTPTTARPAEPIAGPTGPYASAPARLPEPAPSAFVLRRRTSSPVLRRTSTDRRRPAPAPAAAQRLHAASSDGPRRPPPSPAPVLVSSGRLLRISGESRPASASVPLTLDLERLNPETLRPEPNTPPNAGPAGPYASAPARLPEPAPITFVLRRRTSSPVLRRPRTPRP
nr:translation initiation factor IF-2-like [Aegilops tauschii subsp. strangulata]